MFRPVAKSENRSHVLRRLLAHCHCRSELFTKSSGRSTGLELTHRWHQIRVTFVRTPWWSFPSRMRLKKLSKEWRTGRVSSPSPPTTFIRPTPAVVIRTRLPYRNHERMESC